MGYKIFPGWSGANVAKAIPDVIKHRKMNPVIKLDLIRKERNNMHLLTKGRHGLTDHTQLIGYFKSAQPEPGLYTFVITRVADWKMLVSTIMMPIDST